MSVNLYNATTDTLKNVAGDIINPKSVNEMIAPIEDGTASKAYAVGEQFIMNDLLCKATQAIARGDTMVIGTNCEESEQLSKQIKDIKSDLTDYSVNTPLRNVTYYNGKLYQLNLDGTIGSEIDGVKRFVGENFAEIGTKEGSILAHTIYGMSVQDGTPTPDSPVEIKSAKADFRCTGKNLIPYPYSDGTSKTSNGIIFTVNSDGSVTANGTATGESIFTLRQGGAPLNSTNNIKVHTDKNLVLSGCPSGGSPNNYMIQVSLTNGTNIWASAWGDRGKGKSFSFIPSVGYYNIAIIRIVIASGVTANNLTFRPMLILEDADQTYEPYQHTDVTTDITLRAIEVASTDDYTYERDGKYYIADTIDWSEDRGYEITRRVASSTISELTGFIRTTDWQGKQTFVYRDDTTKRTPSNHKSFALSSGYEPQIRDAYISGTASDYGIYTTPTGGIAFTMPLNSYSSKDDFLADQGNQNVQYVLATPTTEPITSEQAQALLSLKTYDEATSISATGDIEPSLDLEYAKSEMGAKALTGHNEAYIAQELESVYGVKNFLGLYLGRSDLPAGITTTLTEDGGIHISGQRTDSQTSDWGLNYTIKGLKKGIAYKFTCNQYDVPRVGMYYVSSNITKPTTFTWTQDGDGTFTIYIAKGVTYDVTIYPMLRLASIQSDEYQPYAMSNRELTVLIKQLQTALLEMGGN